MVIRPRRTKRNPAQIATSPKWPRSKREILGIHSEAWGGHMHKLFSILKNAGQNRIRFFQCGPSARKQNPFSINRRSLIFSRSSNSVQSQPPKTEHAVLIQMRMRQDTSMDAMILSMFQHTPLAPENSGPRPPERSIHHHSSNSSALSTDDITACASMRWPREMYTCQERIDSRVTIDISPWRHHLNSELWHLSPLHLTLARAFWNPEAQNLHSFPFHETLSYWNALSTIPFPSCKRKTGIHISEPRKPRQEYDMYLYFCAYRYKSTSHSRTAQESTDSGEPQSRDKETQKRNGRAYSRDTKINAKYSMYISIVPLLRHQHDYNFSTRRDRPPNQGRLVQGSIRLDTFAIETKLSSMFLTLVYSGDLYLPDIRHMVSSYCRLQCYIFNFTTTNDLRQEGCLF
ncbi:hypothetical protein ABKN59_001477 [Abortiporus biennis]